MLNGWVEDLGQATKQGAGGGEKPFCFSAFSPLVLSLVPDPPPVQYCEQNIAPLNLMLENTNQHPQAG